MIFAPSLVRYCRTLQDKNVSALSRHHITEVRRASYSVRVFPGLRFALSHRDPRTSLAHSRALVIVYDVSSRESFEALPRWLEELENYVSPEVVKIVVGNKLDKVSNDPDSFPYDSPSRLPTPDPSLIIAIIAIIFPPRRLPTGATHAQRSI